MTAFTINGGAITNWDSLIGGSVNATLDSYSISNNTTLKIDTDGHLCANHSTAFGSLDTVSFTGTGGTVLIDGKSVRIIAYTGGSGNVPAIGALISQGGVSATFLGVWASWQVENTASGAAMPPTGFIKVKNKVGSTFAAGALTGIVATSSGADFVGWIEVRGANLATITVPRIGKFQVTGDWFQLGTTTGVRGQILGCPTTGTIAGIFPGVWIETAAGSNIYERFTGVGSMANLATNPTDERGKMVWQTTAGIRIGSDGVNNVGFLPPAGCKVRIPNVILTCCTRTASGSGIRVLPNATLATRQEFITTSAGDIDIDGAVCQWYANFSQAFRTKIYNSEFNDTLLISEVASPLDINNVTVAPTQAQLNAALLVVSCFAGGAIANVQSTRFNLAASNAYVSVANFNKGILFSNVKSSTLLNRGSSSTGVWSTTQNIDCVWRDCTDIGGQFAMVSNVRPVVKNLGYADNFSGATTATNGHYAINAASGTQGLVANGFNFLGLLNVHPYNGLVNVSASYDTLVMNIGSFAARLNLGTALASGVIINGTGNSDNIRLKQIYVSNTRIGLWNFSNSDNDLIAENVFADDANASVMAALNATIKGCRFAASTAGQISVYGTHWLSRFATDTTGFMEVTCNEPTADSALQCASTGGAPKFNSSGSVALTAIGDQVTWTTNYFVKGFTAFANIAPTLTGTNTAYVTYQYQLDTGSGFGTLNTVNGANLSSEMITPEAGFKLKIIATCATANANNYLTNIRLSMVTTAVAQSTNLYPLQTVALTLTGLQSGSDITILAAGTEAVLSNNEDVAGTTFSYVYETAQPVDIVFNKPGFYPEAVRNYTLGLTDATLPIVQKPDASYLY